MSAHNKLIPLLPYEIPHAGIAAVTSVSLDTRYSAVCFQVQTFQRAAPSSEKPYGPGVRNTNPRRGTLECLFVSLRTSRCCTRVYVDCRSQTPGLPWRYIASTAASGRKGRDCRPRTPIARTPPEHGKNGNVHMEKGTTIHLVARTVQALGSRRS